MTDQPFTQTSFYKFLGEHKLMGARCTNCGALYLPPRPLCPQCYSDALEWLELPGEGEIAAFSAIAIAPTAMIEAGYGRDNPYCAGVVKLKNGLSISAQITGVDAIHPESIHIGAPVTVEFLERGEGEKKKTFLAFAVQA